MAYDEGLAQEMRDDLGDALGLSEKKMFGGLCFLVQGNMVSGIHKGGGMFRVGKDNEAKALDVPGARVMAMGGRTMPGMIELPLDLVGDEAKRRALIGIALGFASGLPPK